jgi:hypothetical protein
MNGFRQVPQTSKKEQIKTMDAELKNTQMALRIMQTMVQNLLKSNKNLSDDLANTIGLVNELQYKILAVQSVANLDVSSLSAKADELRLKDFNEAAAKQDAEDGLSTAETVTEASTVTITSSTSGADTGIFRSRFTMAECNVKELKEALMGKNVGTKVKVLLNGKEHEVELLSVMAPVTTDDTKELAV